MSWSSALSVRVLALQTSNTYLFDQDYIRTYTWDKKLESWVKDLGGAGRGEPTIVTPRQYRQRFLSAMERYFSLVSIYVDSLLFANMERLSGS